VKTLFIDMSTTPSWWIVQLARGQASRRLLVVHLCGYNRPIMTLVRTHIDAPWTVRKPSANPRANKVAEAFLQPQGRKK